MPFHSRPGDEGFRLRIPKPGEIIGLVTELHGGARMKVQCSDGKERMARVPGKIKRFIWVKTNDVVICEPWDVEPDTKCDIVYRYTAAQANNLASRGLLKIPQV
ncbi:MAG TPA: translation initiation factor eIF-1A [Candidatus Norongarragalinales archaeon]|jgi:translation initiation factor 1A|nr:translation initiation factor eIF-1A [Candidatus Norongarragalinales archaeon]